MVTKPTVPATPRKAATVILVREGATGPEVLLLRRHGDSAFAAEAWVFPGGTVDEADRSVPEDRWRGLDAAGRIDGPDWPTDLVLGLHVAAVRETFEEAGLLLAQRDGGDRVDLEDPDVRTMRRQLGAREAAAGEFARWLRDAGLVLDLGALVAWGRWITPVDEPRRYDTCFFLARAPGDQVADHDRVETTGQRWMRPGDALDAHAAGRFQLVYPTVRTLEQLADHDTVGGLFDAASRRALSPVLPHFERLADGGTRVLHPEDPEYPRERYAQELAR